MTPSPAAKPLSDQQLELFKLITRLEGATLLEVLDALPFELKLDRGSLQAALGELERKDLITKTVEGPRELYVICASQCRDTGLLQYLKLYIGPELKELLELDLKASKAKALGVSIKDFPE